MRMWKKEDVAGELFLKASVSPNALHCFFHGYLDNAACIWKGSFGTKMEVGIWKETMGEGLLIINRVFVLLPKEQ